MNKIKPTDALNGIAHTEEYRSKIEENHKVIQNLLAYISDLETLIWQEEEKKRLTGDAISLQNFASVRFHVGPAADQHNYWMCRYIPNSEKETE